ncbi:hypothetical protein NL676_033706 [Syzygium grande]|nr:hypothetical protein NL676_033706 [Syzygium grande]
MGGLVEQKTQPTTQSPPRNHGRDPVAPIHAPPQPPPPPQAHGPKTPLPPPARATHRKRATRNRALSQQPKRKGKSPRPKTELGASAPPQQLNRPFREGEIPPPAELPATHSTQPIRARAARKTKRKRRRRRSGARVRVARSTRGGPCSKDQERRGSPGRIQATPLRGIEGGSLTYRAGASHTSSERAPPFDFEYVQRRSEDFVAAPTRHQPPLDTACSEEGAKKNTSAV